MKTLAIMICVAMSACAVDVPNTASNEQDIICGSNCDPADAQAYLRDLVGSYGGGQVAGSRLITTICNASGGVSYCNAEFSACTDQGCGSYIATCDSLGSQDCWWSWL